MSICTYFCHSDSTRYIQVRIINQIVEIYQVLLSNIFPFAAICLVYFRELQDDRGMEDRSCVMKKSGEMCNLILVLSQCAHDKSFLTRKMKILQTFKEIE